MRRRNVWLCRGVFNGGVAGAAVAAPAVAQTPVTAFAHVAVIPMDRERVLTDQTVVVRGDRIMALGPAGEVSVPAGAAVIDGRGRYLMPGLADMHAHVPSWPGILQSLFDSWTFPEGRLAEAERILALYALNGVTTVRLMYGWPETLELRQRAAAGQLFSPRIYTAANPPLYPGDTPESGFMLTLQPAEVVTAITEAKAAGYDFVKMYGVTGAAFDSAVATARRVGLPIAGHVPKLSTAQGLEQAIAAHYASIEHLDGFREFLAATAPRVHADQTGDPDHAAEVEWPAPETVDTGRLRTIARAMREAGVWSCPTQILYEEKRWDAAALAQWPELRYLSDTTRRSWLTERESATAAVLAQAATTMATRALVVRTLHEAGVGLLLGTDAPLPFILPGFSVHRELQLLVAAGLTPYEALATGTRNVAAFFGTLDSTGTVAVGKRADLVLLGDNPLADIRHTSQLQGVMLAGRWLSRAELDAQLAALEGKVF